MTGKVGNVQGTRTASGAQPKRHQPDAQRSSRPRASGPSHPRSLSIRDVKDCLTPTHIEILCREWLSHGRRQGGWWVCATPWRDDHDPSLGVSLTTGRWRDFATGDSGDMIDLSMRLFGDSLRETIEGFAEMLGLSS